MKQFILFIVSIISLSSCFYKEKGKVYFKTFYESKDTIVSQDSNSEIQTIHYAPIRALSDSLNELILDSIVNITVSNDPQYTLDISCQTVDISTYSKVLIYECHFMGKTYIHTMNITDIRDAEIVNNETYNFNSHLGDFITHCYQEMLDYYLFERKRHQIEMDMKLRQLRESQKQ